MRVADRSPVRTTLPIDDHLPNLLAALDAENKAVLVAPPGAGKTTRVPPALLAANWSGTGRILVLEPRRLAARAAARRMAAERGEEVGATIGYRVRFDSRVSKATRIEVVTGGVFIRQIQSDPELTGVAAVIFDEFHERSLDADLGLALALDCQAGLRDDLRIVVMSATLDAKRIADHLDRAPVIESQGRQYPVETHYLPRRPDARVEQALTDVCRTALSEYTGSILAFLPGQAEIHRTAKLLADRLPPDTDICPLYGALDMADQDRAVKPPPPGRRKIVLATPIAEASITIAGVDVVVDCGLARRPAYEPASGLTRLETVRASKAAVDQRRGRAGRTGPGHCYRLWSEGQTRALAAHDRPEIQEADLAGLVLDLAVWGVREPDQLTWLDPPPQAAVNEARALLNTLGALDDDGGATDIGRRMRTRPVHPRLSHMITACEPQDQSLAATIAALLSEPGLGGRSRDLRDRLRAFRSDNSRRAKNLKRQAGSWLDADAPAFKDTAIERTGVVLALAYPDRLAQARGLPGSYRLANGRGAILEGDDPLFGTPYLAIAHLQGDKAGGRIFLASPISKPEIERLFADQIETRPKISFDPEKQSVQARVERRFGRLVLESQVDANPDPQAVKAVLIKALADRGVDRLPWTKASLALRGRCKFLHKQSADQWPDLSDAALTANLAEWLGPFLDGISSIPTIRPALLSDAMDVLLPYHLRQELDRSAPSHFEAPTGSKVLIDYTADAGPTISIRVQEVYGIAIHPQIGGVPLVFELLSPAQRPIQVTTDLPGFWRGSWADVRADMKGRYPKHPWPDDPSAASPTRRAKPR